MNKKENHIHFGCESCPLGEDVRNRMESLGEDVSDYQFEYCQCDKLGTLFNGGTCEDSEEFEEMPSFKVKGKRNTGSAYRRRMARKAKKRRLDICEFCFKPSLGYIHEDKYWVPAKNSNAQRYHKRRSNKKIRQGRNIPRNPAGYRKMYDYYWNWF